MAANLEGYKEVQSAVDTILGINSIVKRKRKRESDKKMELFVQMITKLEAAVVKSNLMYMDFELDLSKYDEQYFIIIDILIYMGFGDNCAELISYYIWDRYAPDGSILPLYNEHDQEVLLRNPYDLWELLCSVNPKLLE
jgi:hypothetical protein